MKRKKRTGGSHEKENHAGVSVHHSGLPGPSCDGQKTAHGAAAGGAREGLRVALSQSEALTPWKTAQINSFKEAAEGRGLELVYHSPEEETLTWQLQDIRELFAEGIDYLILVPRVRSGYDDILLEAKERGSR